MPKQVDPDVRRRHVIDALFRVVVREGLHRTSLRAVADEAQLNIGSLRHYFASQQDLMRFAMQAMLDQVSHRLLGHIDRIGDLSRHSRPEQLQLAAGFLTELLPLDEHRRAEVTVFLDFNTAARTNPAFGDLSRKAAEGTRWLMHRVLSRLDASGALRPDLNLSLETERLTALMDGLSLSSLLHPEILKPQACIDVLLAHLSELSPPSGGATPAG